MTYIKFPCPECHRGVAAPVDKIGKRGTCPYCHQRVLVHSPLPVAELACGHDKATSPVGSQATDRHGPDTDTNHTDSHWPRVALVAISCLLVLAAVSLIYFFGSGSEAGDDSRLAQTETEDERIAMLGLSELSTNRNPEKSAADKKTEPRNSVPKKQSTSNPDEQVGSNRKNNQAGKIAELEKSIEALERAMTDESDLDQRGKIISLRSILLAAKEPVSIPNSQEDVIWISSVPPGADVWCAYRSEIENDMNWAFRVMYLAAGTKGNTKQADQVSEFFSAKHYRGKTPLVMEAIPGRYLIGVGLPISKEHGTENLKIFPYLPTEAKETVVSRDGTMTAYTRLFEIEKKAGQLATINTLFCPQTSEYSTFSATFPKGVNFTLDENKVRSSLEEINQGRWDGETVSVDQVQSVLNSLKRSATAMWPAKQDGTYFVAGLRGYDSLVLARAKKHSVSDILSPPSIPKIPDLSIPNLNIPNLNLPNIKIPPPNINLAPPAMNLPHPTRIPGLNGSPSVSPYSNRRNTRQDPTHSRDSNASKRARYQQNMANEQLKIADRYIRAGKLASAKKRLQTLIENYPETPAARQAKLKLEQLE